MYNNMMDDTQDDWVWTRGQSISSCEGRYIKIQNSHDRLSEHFHLLSLNCKISRSPSRNSNPNFFKMQAVIVFLALVAAASAGVVAPIAYAPTIVARAPAFDSAVIKSDRLGGNFAYSVAENHAYAAHTPIVQHVTSPVAVSYSAPAVHYAAAAAPVAYAAGHLGYAAGHLGYAAGPIAYGYGPSAVRVL